MVVAGPEGVPAAGAEPAAGAGCRGGALTNQYLVPQTTIAPALGTVSNVKTHFKRDNQPDMGG